MSGSEELQALLVLRNQRLQEIAHKRQQVERQRQVRAEKAATVRPDEPEVNLQIGLSGEGLNKCVDSLLNEILCKPPANTAEKKNGKLKPVSAEAPLKELQKNATKIATTENAVENYALHCRLELSVGGVTIDPQRKVQYERGSQTTLGSEPPQDGVTGALAMLTRGFEKSKTMGFASDGQDDSPESTVKKAANMFLSKRQCAKTEDSGKTVSTTLSREQRERIEQSPEFKRFFDKTSLLVERSLGQQTVERSISANGGSECSEEELDDRDESLKYFDDFTDPRRVFDRPVTDIKASPHHKEMFLASYGQCETACLSDPEGCLLIWNLAMNRRPEAHFRCNSSVLTAQFNRFEPAVFFGGTRSSGFVIWDARAKQDPVMRSNPCVKGHTHAVQAIHHVGAENASSLITASTDGRICTWSLAMLNEPQDCIDLKYDAKSRREVPIMSMSAPKQDSNTIFVGGEDGGVCQCSLLGGGSVEKLFDSHEGPVTTIDVHPTLSGDTAVAITSSFDWTVRLWSIKEHTAPIMLVDSFEDYVLDVRWHPHHPGIFAAVDGEGQIMMWNLCRRMESPVFTQDASSAKCLSGTKSVWAQPKRLAINRCQWSQDGQRFYTGDSEGTLSVYTCQGSMNASSKDILQLQDHIREMQPIVPSPTSPAGISKTKDRSCRRK